MASPASQAKAQALNSKLEGEARTAIDDIDKRYMRVIAKASHQCALNCYDKAGQTGSSDALEQCVRNCQAKHQQANAYVQSVSTVQIGSRNSVLLFWYFFVSGCFLRSSRTPTTRP